MGATAIAGWLGAAVGAAHAAAGCLVGTCTTVGLLAAAVWSAVMRSDSVAAALGAAAAVSWLEAGMGTVAAVAG